MNKNSSYSVYVDSRPMRVAYLMNSKNVNVDVFDDVINLNQKCWGGRFTPIILLKGGAINNEQLDFLSEYDPDIIKSIGEIKASTITKLSFSTAPYHFDESAIKDHVRIDVDDERLEFLPSPEFISSVTRDELNRIPLVLFDIKKLKNENIKKFINRNFGTIEDLYYTKKSLENVNLLSFEVADEKSLTNALDKLSEHRGGFIFPIQLCSDPCSVKEIKRENHYEEDLEIIIGDSMDDVIWHWNKPLAVNYWKRSHINSFWLPKALSENNEFLKVFSVFMRKFSKSWTSNGFNSLNLLSFSLKNKELNGVLKKMDVTFFNGSKITKLKKQLYPKYEKFFTFDRLKNGMQHFRFNSPDEILNIRNPINLTSIKNIGHWMTDLYVNKGLEELYYSNLETWLQLPSKNVLTKYIFSSTPSRVTLSGLPSCVVRMPSSGPISDPGNSIKFKLISEEEIFRSLMLVNCKAFKDISYYYTNDARKKIKTKEFINDIEISNSGKYLRGFIGNFDGLSTASYFFEQKFWSTMFDFLAGKDIEKDGKLLKEIGNKIRKDVKNGFIKIENNNIGKLPNYVLDLSKKYNNLSLRGSKYNLFLEKLKEEINELKKKNLSASKKKREIDRLKNDLKENIDSLIELNVLSLGFNIKCPNCGFYEWISLKEASQNIDCKGCSFNFTLGSENEWSYRLNSLVQVGIDQHNLVPVVMSLNKLMQRARHFFAFYPTLNVFHPKKKTPFTDIDIICIVDGKLILGECKLSDDDFEVKDFKNMEIIGRALRPDEIVFYSLRGTPNANLNRKINDLKNKLKPLNVKVKWIGTGYVPNLDRRD